MTPANRKKFKALGAKLIEISKENPSASACIFHIFSTIISLAQMANDFHLRPEANDANLHPRR